MSDDMDFDLNHIFEDLESTSTTTTATAPPSTAPPSTATANLDNNNNNISDLTHVSEDFEISTSTTTTTARASVDRNINDNSTSSTTPAFSGKHENHFDNGPRGDLRVSSFQQGSRDSDIDNMKPNTDEFVRVMLCVVVSLQICICAIFVGFVCFSTSSLIRDAWQRHIEKREQKREIMAEREKLRKEEEEREREKQLEDARRKKKEEDDKKRLQAMFEERKKFLQESVQRDLEMKMMEMEKQFVEDFEEVKMLDVELDTTAHIEVKLDHQKKTSSAHILQKHQPLHHNTPIEYIDSGDEDEILFSGNQAHFKIERERINKQREKKEEEEEEAIKKLLCQNFLPK